MTNPTNSPLHCPTCRGPVFEQRRALDTEDRVALLFADLPFWILFGICVAIGMLEWLAGVVTFAVALLVFYQWHRKRYRWHCFACNASFGYRELQPADGEESNLQRWLGKARKIQWDRKNIVRRNGRLEKLK